MFFSAPNSVKGGEKYLMLLKPLLLLLCQTLGLCLAAEFQAPFNFRRNEMKQKITGFLTCWLAAGVLAAPSSAATSAQDVSAALKRALQKSISSPGGNMVVKITPSSKTAQGYFAEVYVAARPAQIKKRRFSEFVMRAKNVRLDVPKLMKGNIKTLASQTTLRAIITEDELTQALARGQDSAGKKLKVKFAGNGQVRVTGNWKMSWFSGPMDAVGTLRLGPNYTVVADIASLKLNGKLVPAGVKNKFQQKINPLLDYEDLPFRPPFKSLKFSGSKAVITAG